MPSILSRNQAPDQQDQTGTINSLITQILSAANPQEAFNQMVQSNKDAKNAMDLINQYGGGDPKTAFMNYMNSTGKQSLGQQIMQKLGLS